MFLNDDLLLRTHPTSDTNQKEREGIHGKRFARLIESVPFSIQSHVVDATATAYSSVERFNTFVFFGGGGGS